MLERTPYHQLPDPGSTITSVVRRPGNPQQVVVTEVDVPEFYNQANDMQPSRVDPRWGINHTQPAILRPDPMWSHRWPDEGPYRGMTAQPFSWERAQVDGLGAITQAQRDRYAALTARANELTGAVATARRSARTTGELGRLALIDGQLERARALLTEADAMQDEELLMAMDDVAFELDQVEERLASLEAAPPAEAGAGGAMPGIGRALLIGGAIFGLGYWLARR